MNHVPGGRWRRRAGAQRRGLLEGSVRPVGVVEASAAVGQRSPTSPTTAAPWQEGMDTWYRPDAPQARTRVTLPPNGVASCGQLA